MKKVVTFGEVMMRLATPGFERFSQASEFKVTYGGGEANVAASLANFGIPNEFVTQVPDNNLGEACLQNLRKVNIGTNFIKRGGKRLGKYFLETGAVARGSKVIYDRDDSAVNELKPGMIDWKEVFKDAQWFHWTGITPSLSQNAADVCLEAAKAANEMGLTVSCDLNYRKNLWKYGKKASEVMPAIVENCDIILGNEEDAEMVFGIAPEDTDVTSGELDAKKYRKVCEELMQKFPKAKKVIITLRGSISASHNTWSGVLYDGETLHEGNTFQITHIVDRVGGGDSFMGGLIYGLLHYPDDDKTALNFAIAASCLKHTIPGDFNLVSVSEVEKLLGGDASGRVSR